MSLAFLFIPFLCFFHPLSVIGTTRFSLCVKKTTQYPVAQKSTQLLLTSLQVRQVVLLVVAWTHSCIFVQLWICLVALLILAGLPHMFWGSLAVDWYKIISDGLCLAFLRVVSHFQQANLGLIQEKSSSAQELFQATAWNQFAVVLVIQTSHITSLKVNVASSQQRAQIQGGIKNWDYYASLYIVAYVGVMEYFFLQCVYSVCQQYSSSRFDFSLPLPFSKSQLSLT